MIRLEITARDVAGEIRLDLYQVEEPLWSTGEVPVLERGYIVLPAAAAAALASTVDVLGQVFGDTVSIAWLGVPVPRVPVPPAALRLVLLARRLWP